MTCALAIGGSIADRLQAPALDHDRRVPVGRLHAGAHLPQRLGDPLLGPARERLVADELESPLLAGQDPGGEPHNRPGVAEVERGIRRAQPVQADPADENRLRAVVVDLGPELPDDRERRLRVGSAPEAVDSALAVRDRAEQHRALGDPLHPRNRDRALDRRRGLDLHSSMIGDTTTP